MMAEFANLLAIQIPRTSVITQYSCRSTTFVKDRFPALSSIAHDPGAGPVRALCWHVDSILEHIQWHTETETPLSCIESTPENYLPSWSWASTNGCVAWFPSSEPLQRYETINEARIGNVRCRPAAINPFGKIRPGLAPHQWLHADCNHRMLLAL
jgi:hypothetical protein